MNKIKFNNKIKALATCVGFFSLAACKETSVSKTTLTPEIDNIHTFGMSADSFDITFNNKVTDSISTSRYFIADSVGNSFNALAVGQYTDPFFGKTKASAYLQVTPYKANFKFPANTIIDSAVLVLPFATTTYRGRSYGDTNAALNLKVYKTTESVNVTKTYFSSNNLAIEATPIGSATVPYSSFGRFSKQIIGATRDTTNAQLRIKLNYSFASEIKNLDTGILTNTTNFLAYLKGLYITTDQASTANLMAYFLLPTAANNEKNLGAARIEFHYRNTPQDSAMMSSFPVKPSVNGYFTNISRSYANYPAAGFINRNADTLLVEGQPGFYTDITINNLNKIPLAVINKAELVITAISVGNDANYTALGMLYPKVLINNKEQSLYELLSNQGDETGIGGTFVNPYAKKVTIGGLSYMQYRINIPRTLQRVINDGKTSVTIRLSGAAVAAPASINFPGMNRVLAPGKTNADTKFQFNIIYTKQ